MATYSGSLPVADIIDGQTGATIVLSNENHTFIADAEGVITTSELAMFVSDQSVFVGATALSYVTTQTTPGTGNYTLTSTAISGNTTHRRVTAVFSPNALVDLEVRVRNSDGELSVVDANTGIGFIDIGGVNSVTISLPFIVTIEGNAVQYTRAISLSKAIGGSAPYVRMTANMQTIPYAFDANAPKSSAGNLVLTANSFNFASGAMETEWSYSVDGAAFTAIDEDNAPTGVTFSGLDTDVSTMTVTPGAFNTFLSAGLTVTFRMTRGGIQFDQISIAKLEDAEGAYNVTVTVIGGSNILKNNPTAVDTANNSTYCDMEVKLYLSGTLLTPAATWTYAWRKDGTLIPAAGEGALSATQPTGYGRTSDKIRLSGGDVDDNGTNIFTCDITVP